MDQVGQSFLQALGHPALRRGDGSVAAGLRRKDLALLAYLAVEGGRPHARGRLATLLWGESPEALARHSLTQSLGRIRRSAGPGALVVRKESVRWTGVVPCDAALLLSREPHPLLDDALTVYAGPFLEGFEAGFGSADFDEWAGRKRADLRDAALRWLEERGARAEAAEEWERAQRLGERAAAVDPVAEQVRRRVMRALAARGERNRALRYYEQYAAWLANEVGGEPDPDTRALAERLRATEGFGPPGEARRSPSPAPPPRSAPPPAPDPPSVPLTPEDASKNVPALATPSPSADAAPAPDGGWWRLRRVRMAAATAVGALVWVGVRAAFVPRQVEPPPAYGESIRAGGGPVYLVWSGALWEYPDSATLSRCLGGWMARLRPVRRLPPWPRRALLSVRTHPWQGGTEPAVTDAPVDPTQYVAAGCVLAPIPDPETFRRIFGHTDWARSYVEADTLLLRSPRTTIAAAFPVRRPGTLLRAPGGALRWVLFHGGAAEVRDPAVLATYCRRTGEAVPVGDVEFSHYRPHHVLAPASRPCAPAASPPDSG